MGSTEHPCLRWVAKEGDNIRRISGSCISGCSHHVRETWDSSLPRGNHGVWPNEREESAKQHAHHCSLDEFDRRSGLP